MVLMVSLPSVMNYATKILTHLLMKVKIELTLCKMRLQQK